MYSIYVLALAGILISVYPHVKNKKSPFLFLDAGFGAVAGTITGALVAFVLGTWVPKHDVTYGPATLVAVSSANGTAGTFVWGTGSVNSQVFYNFMQRNTDGSLTPGQIPANHFVRIIEDKDLKDVGSWQSTFSEMDKSSFLYNWALPASDQDELVKHELRVPAGTVVQGFSIK